MMSILTWILVGLVAGFLASKIVNKRGLGVFFDTVLGAVGALVGGFLFSGVGAAGMSGLNIWSIFVAVVGSVIVLIAYHAIVGRRAARG